MQEVGQEEVRPLHVEVDQVAATEQAAEPQVRRLSHGWKRLQGTKSGKKGPAAIQTFDFQTCATTCGIRILPLHPQHSIATLNRLALKHDIRPSKAVCVLIDELNIEDSGSMQE